jgi:predicted aspartyl protease
MEKHTIFAHIPIGEIEPYQKPILMCNQEFKLNIHKQIILTSYLLGKSGKAIIYVKTLIDTGSFYNVCSKRILEEINPLDTEKTIKYQPLSGVEVFKKVYYANILIPNVLNEYTPFEFSIEDSVFNDIDMIIGTQFLSNFELNYNSPKGEYSLKWLGK